MKRITGNGILSHSVRMVLTFVRSNTVAAKSDSEHGTAFGGIPVRKISSNNAAAKKERGDHGAS